MACLSFLHQWKGCKCEKCGVLRDEGHVLSECKCQICHQTLHEYKASKHYCSRCGKINPDRDVHQFIVKEYTPISFICLCVECRQHIHLWKGCKCEACGVTRDEEHDWQGCRCRNCGKVAHKSGKDCTCVHCGIVFHEIKKDCQCENCHQYIHKWNHQGECACGMKRDILPYWDQIQEMISIGDQIHQTLRMDGVHPSQVEEARLKEIGKDLDCLGGRKLMGEVKGYVDGRRPNYAQFISQIWDGIGEWKYNEGIW